MVGFRRVDLGAVAQMMISKDQGEHGFSDRNGADADAGVVAAGRADIGLVAVAVYRASWCEN
jgi:hypothetical protein